VDATVEAVKHPAGTATWRKQQATAREANKGDVPSMRWGWAQSWVNFQEPEFDEADHVAERANGFRP